MKVAVLHCKDSRWYAFIARIIQFSAKQNNQYPINHDAGIYSFKCKSIFKNHFKCKSIFKNQSNTKYVYELKFTGAKYTKHTKFLEKYKGEIWKTEFDFDCEPIDLKKYIKSRKFKYSIPLAASAFEFHTKFKSINKFLDFFKRLRLGNSFCLTVQLHILRHLNSISKIPNKDLEKYFESIDNNLIEQTPADFFEYCKKNIHVVKIK